MVTYTQRGGANVNGLYASWPFGKIEVAPGKILLSVLGQRLTLSPADIISIRVRFGGIDFNYRRPMLAEGVVFECFSKQRLLDALHEAGFAVQRGGDDFTS